MEERTFKPAEQRSYGAAESIGTQLSCVYENVLLLLPWRSGV